MTDLETLREELACGVDTVDLWNRNILPKMRDRSEEYKRLAHAEAKRRGYEYDKDLEIYLSPWKMYALKGHNVIAAGWRDGVLRVAFAGKGGARFYQYHGVPEAEFVKLRNSPYPDRLFTTNIKNKDYKVTPE
jgi:KTSC domain